ncbi:MAG TPA: dihydrofolate reductase family protein [Paracoccaceae bacterium]|nr:dihydrofolate reductase family protein [Paracoccaceae bacterium]
MKIFIAQTIDGYIAGPDGSIDHLKPFEENEYGYDAFMASVDGIVMGRNTFDSFYPDHGWPYPASLPAIVMTHRILPQGVPSHVRVSESIDKAAELMPNAYVDGGFVISQCLARGLVKEARIFTVPVLLGTGVRLFPEGAHSPENWRLLANRAFPCGTVESHFQIP